MIIKGNKISLRHPITEDLDVLFLWENDPDIWQFGDFTGPYTKEDISDFIDQGQDLLSKRQERLMIIDTASKIPVGCLDLYDFDPAHKRAGVGILIYSKKNRNKGLATEAFQLFNNYLKNEIKLKQVYCTIEESNHISLNFFKKLKFEEVGLKNAWRFHKGKWYGEYLLQLIIN